MVAWAWTGNTDLLVGIVAGCYVALTALATVQIDSELEKVIGQAILDSLNSAHLTVKEASALMGMEESNLRSALRGEGRYRVAVSHLARLPFGFWQWFGPTLFALLVKRNLASMAEDMGLRKSA